MSGIYYVFYAIEIIALIVGSYFIRRVNKDFLLLYFFVLAGVLSDSLNILLIKHGLHNMPVTHFYFPIEFTLLALFYKTYLAPVLKGKWISLIIAIYITFALINPLFIQSLQLYSQMRIYSSLILVVFSSLYFYRLLNELKISKLSADPMVWLNSSILILYSANFFYNLLFNLLLRDLHVLRIAATFIGCLVSLFYLIIVISFWKAAKQQKAVAA